MNAATWPLMGPGLLRNRLATAIMTILPASKPKPPLRIAVDGPDAAGKSTLADSLAAELRRREVTVIRASADDFQHPRARRYQRGPLSALGYYYDAFDYVRLEAELLAPLDAGGGSRYRRAYFDWRADRPRPAPWAGAPAEAVLLLDGVFLLRPRLRQWWDMAIYVHVSPATSLTRALRRDGTGPDSNKRLARRYRRRYLPAQHGYRRACRPWQRADVVVDNEDPSRPRALFLNHDLR